MNTKITGEDELRRVDGLSPQTGEAQKHIDEARSNKLRSAIAAISLGVGSLFTMTSCEKDKPIDPVEQVVDTTPINKGQETKTFPSGTKVTFTNIELPQANGTVRNVIAFESLEANEGLIQSFIDEVNHQLGTTVFQGKDDFYAYLKGNLKSAGDFWVGEANSQTMVFNWSPLGVATSRTPTDEMLNTMFYQDGIYDINDIKQYMGEDKFNTIFKSVQVIEN